MLKELREELIHTLLTGSNGATTPVGVSVYNHWPERFAPPGILVKAPRSGMYVVGGQFPGHYEISLDLYVVVKTTSPVEASIENVDLIVENVLRNTADWGLRGVDSHTLIDVNGANLPGTIIHLAKQAEL